MDLRKTILAVGLLAAVVTAGVLDTNDVKMNSTLGLGANPAAIAVNKQSKVEAGTIAVNNLSQSNQIKDGEFNGISLFDGKNINSSSFNDATKFLSYTDVWNNNWFSVRYRYESNLYPNFSANLTLPSPVLQNLLDPNFKAKGTMYRKDALETVAFQWARELVKGFSGGVELATNIYTLDDQLTFNKAAKDISHAMLGGSPFQDTKAYSQSGSYYTLTLGGIYDIANNQKVSLSQKFSQDRGVYTNDDKGSQYSYTESLPNETGLAYIFAPNNALEVAAVFKTFWGTTYERNVRHSDKPEYTETVRILPCNSYGFAASYAATKEVTLQGYGNFLRNYKASDISGYAEEQGYNVSQLGGNIQYAPSFFNGGKILLGSYVTRLVSEDQAVGRVFDITNTSLSYSHSFNSLWTPSIAVKK